MAELMWGGQLIRNPLPSRLEWAGSGALGVGHSPNVALVGGVLDVIADVGEHFLCRPAVSGIKHLGPAKGQRQKERAL